MLVSNGLSVLLVCLSVLGSHMVHLFSVILGSSDHLVVVLDCVGRCVGDVYLAQVNVLCQR